WMRNRVESDLAIACDRIGVAHVSSLLRSPDVVRLLVEWGTPLENPATGERMARSPETGEIECDFSTDLSLVDSQEEDEAALMDWYCLRVASDDRWRVDGDVALHIAYDKEGPWAELRETARAAYLADPWLTTRARVEAIPTVERTQDLLAREDPAEVRRGYRVREECESRDVRPPGKGSPVPPRERVA
ncbi:MAG: hypothetical protein U0J70_11365, partial [Atopobiaceae bacterium]|nr:hypothetical protein [Atopobiaceae bacterium]